VAFCRKCGLFVALARVVKVATQKIEGPHQAVPPSVYIEGIVGTHALHDMHPTHLTICTHTASRTRTHNVKRRAIYGDESARTHATHEHG
jgi:hypothetical protein